MKISGMTPQIRNIEKGGAAKPSSKVDSFSGDHTTSIIVGVLFVLTLAAIVILVACMDSINDNLVVGLVGILGTLGGFFAATLRQKQ